MGTVESTQSANYDILQKDEQFYSPFNWELHHAKSKADGSFLSIFKCGVKSACVLNGFKKIRMFRHPCILKYVEGNESDTGVFYATELAIPLCEWLEYAKGKKKTVESDPLYPFLPSNLDNDQLVSWCMWGLANILKALKFINEDAKQVHGFIHPSSIFVTQSGSWKLGCFDLTYDFRSKEEPPLFYMEKQDNLPNDYRSPERQQGNYKLIGDCVGWSQDMYSFGQLLSYVFNGLSIPDQLNNYSLRCKSAPLGRPAPSRLLSAFSKHPLVKSLNFLEEKAIKDPIQKETFFNNLNNSLSKFPSAITVEYILPLLMDELIHGQPEFSPIILPSVIIIGGSLPAERFSKEISPLITQLFGRRDRATRLQLLKNIDSYIKYIDKRVINQEIFPQVVLGFNDTSANMREATIRTMIPLSPYLDAQSQTSMLKGLSSLQEDQLPAIRTNVLVCLNKIIADLDPGVRKQYAFPCIGRGMKDPFPKARIQSLKTIKNTQHYFENGLLARRILPSLCPLLWDVESSVRDMAFDCVQSLLNRIYVGHLEWNKTGEEPKQPVVVKENQNLLNAAGGLVSSAVNWAMGNNNNTSSSTTTKQDSTKPITGISSNTVNQVMSTQPIELNMDDIESFGKKPSTNTPKDPLSTSENDSMWNDDNKSTANTNTSAGWDDWGKDDLDDIDNTKETSSAPPPVVKPSIENMGGWGKEDNLFSEDEEDDEEKKKENENLALIQQMAKKKDMKESAVKSTGMNLKSTKPTKGSPMDLDDWAVSLMNEEKKTTRSKRVKKEAPVKTGWDDDNDLFGEESKPSKTSVVKKNDDWDDWDEKPVQKTKSSSSLNMDDDWNEKPSKPATTVKKNDGWDDWDEKPSKPVTTKKSDGWDDWDEKPSKPTTTTVKKNDGWDDWDEKPSKPTTTVKKSDGWDDWDAKPAQSTPVKKSSGWDDWDEKPTTVKKSDGWDDW